MKSYGIPEHAERGLLGPTGGIYAVVAAQDDVSPTVVDLRGYEGRLMRIHSAVSNSLLCFASDSGDDIFVSGEYKYQITDLCPELLPEGAMDRYVVPPGYPYLIARTDTNAVTGEIRIRLG